MRDTPTTVQSALRVESILEPMLPVLSERARAVFANLLPEPTPSMFYFGCLYAAPPDAETRLANHHDFAHRVNYLVDQLDGQSYVYTHRKAGEIPVSSFRSPTAHAAIAPPMEIPLAGDRVLLVAYVFIQDTPTGAEGKAWLNNIVGEQIRCALDGELPQNPPGLPTPPEPLPVDLRMSIAGRLASR